MSHENVLANSVSPLVGFAALSASDDDQDGSIISSQLASVQISKAREKSYKDAMYPRSTKHFLPLIEELTSISARTNGLFALLRYIVSNSRRLVLMDKAGQATAINAEAERILRNVSTPNREVMANFVGRTNSGKNHVIKPSTRYNGGFDFQFVGGINSPSNPAQAQLGSLYVPYSEYDVIEIVPAGKGNSSLYQQEFLENYASELAQGAVAAANEIMQMIFGESAVTASSAHRRTVRSIPLNFDFSRVNDVILRHTGIVLTVDMMENVKPAVQSTFNEFFSIAAVRTPKAELMRYVAQKLHEQSRAAENNDVPLPPNYLEDILTQEGMALQQIVSYSFTLNLPKDLTNYIAQANEGERVSKASLHNWVSIWTRRYIRMPGARTEGGRVRLSTMPRIVPPLSKTQNITELRTQNGFHVEPGKGDEHNIFIAPDGTLQYGLPTALKDEIAENLTNYERDMEEYIEFCFEHNIPVQASAALPSDVLTGAESLSLQARYKELNDKIRSYSGKILAYDWDYNILTTANVADPTAIVTRDLNGAAKPDPIALADYLGYNFAEEGATPIRKSFADSLVLMVSQQEEDKRNIDVVSSPSDPVQFTAPGGPVAGLLQFYVFHMWKERVPSIESLVAQAAQELGYQELPALEQQILGNLINHSLSPTPGALQTAEGAIEFIKETLARTITHCNAGPYFRQMVYEENEGMSVADLNAELENHPHYFNPATSPASAFGNTYNYMGGRIFRIAMEKLTEISPKDLFSVEEPIEVGGMMGRLYKAPYAQVSRRYLPAAVLFSKYIPNADTILTEAETLVEANKADPSISEQDIRISGAIEGAQAFPHQVRAHGSLRRQPAFAILDIAPGGGKTTLGVTDIASLVTELDEIGADQIRPLILCPDNLIKNWVDDMKMFTGTKWNMIPVNNQIMARWGYERLGETIENAPVNSIVVCGFNFLNNRKETLVIGNQTISVSNNLEFMKRFGFNYICIDESHKLKNKATSRHKNVKQLTTGSHVRYLRIATGTLINDRVSDIVGQASLYNGHIFRDGEVSKSSVAEVEEKVNMYGDEVPVWSVDSPQRARQKLGRFASVVTMRKKEWAFMLPVPIETFIAVPMVPNDGGASEEDIRLGELHKQLYDAVLAESMEELDELIKKAKGTRSDDDDDGDDDSDGEEGEDLEIEQDSELAGVNMADLTPYLARIERLVTNPMADPLAPDVFGAAGVEHYHSTKARYIAKRIEKHFNPDKWDRSKLYEEHTLLSFDGKLYLSRKLDQSTPKRVLLPETTKGVSPADDPDTWKEEAEGKIIVFCRYTNSVNGIYNALPEEYRRIAVKFTGEEDDKWANFDAFSNNPRVKILVANEMGIAEGHNMQMASRLIRVESPWAPGDLDQSSSRIFRPDPKAAKDMVNKGKPGELAREAIYLDWVMCDNTMEVTKQARLIAKIFNKARFDEAQNDKYDDLLSSRDLEDIRMSLDVLRSRASLADFTEYVEAYAELNGIQRQEFHEMRTRMDHTMKPLEAQPEVQGSAKIQTPFVSNQKPDDPDAIQLVSMRNMLRNDEHQELRADPTNMRGMPIVTDLGKGRIVSVRSRTLKRAQLDAEGKPVRNPSRGKRPGSIKKIDVLDGQGRKVVDPDNPVTSFRVKLAGSNEIVNFTDAGSVFIPTNLSASAAKEFAVNNLAATPTEERRSAREEERRRKEEADARRKAEKEEERELIKEERRRRKAKQEIEARRQANEDGKKRKKNLEEGKPVNAGIRRKPKVPPIQSGFREDGTPTDADGDMTITLNPAYWHGYLTLEMDSTDTDPKLAKKHGFRETGPYAYVTADRYARYDKVLDYIEKHFELSDASARRLEAVQDAFDRGPKEIYRMELMAKSTLPMFFNVNKRRVTNPKEVRPYPIIMPDRLHIAVDIKTNPAVRKHIGKSVPGAVTKWREHPGHYLFFAQTKGEMRERIRLLKRAGFTIANEEELKAEITAIRFRAANKR